MCGSTDCYGFCSCDKNVMKIKAFFIRFSGYDSCTQPFPDSLTLLYPPRINETALQISGFYIRPDSPAFLTLHHMVNVKTKAGEAIYGSKERVRAGDGVRFEVYSREEKVLKGAFRREEAQKWKMECECALEGGDGETVGGERALADVGVAVEGDAAMGERVAMSMWKKTKKNKRVGFGQEAIPEEREGESELDAGDLGGMPGGDFGDSEEMDTDVERGSWAFDVGIWVLCFGVGYLFSKASAKCLRRMRLP